MIVSRKHKRLPLRTTAATRITQLPEGHWKQAFPDVLEGYDFFKALDESSLKQFSLHYIIAYDKKAPVGATSCFLMDYPLDTSISGPLRLITDPIKKLFPRIFNIKILMCGMPLGQGRIGASGDTAQVMQALLRRLERIARKNKALAIVFKDFDRHHEGLLDPLKEQGFLKIEALPSTELALTFKDFEEYLKGLSGATRYDLRRKFKQIDGRVAIDFQTVTHLNDDELKDVYQLYLNILDRHELGFELLPMEFFRNISRNMPERARYFLWRIDGKLVAFVLAFVSQDLFMDYYLGLDYSVAHKHHLYFVKFRDTLRWCIAHGIKKYDMGYTGYETKVRLNFSLITQYLYMKPRSALIKPFFGMVCRFLRFENFDKDLKKAKKHEKVPRRQ